MQNKPNIKTEDGKMRAENRRKNEKQTQFWKKSSRIKSIINKELSQKLAIGHLVKTNPICNYRRQKTEDRV